MNKKKSRIKIGKDFDFVAEATSNHEFKNPIYQSNTYIGKRGYSLIKLNHLSLSGKVRNRPIRGSAYFQRILLTVPPPSWYWGIFHFQNGGVLTYFNPHFLGKSIKKDITFFDGKKMHVFKDITVLRKGEKIPIFTILGENRHEKIKFVVDSYSHSSWTFKKKAFKIFPSKLVYNEYPAVISYLKLTDKRTGKSFPLYLGNSVGNAEHSTGFLI
jgi:hypothetical protein